VSLLVLVHCSVTNLLVLFIGSATICRVRGEAPIIQPPGPREETIVIALGVITDIEFPRLGLALLF
jgi:hypothetical protein